MNLPPRRRYGNAFPILAMPAPLLVFAILAVGLQGREARAWDGLLMRLVHAASTPMLDRLALVLSALGSSAGLALVASSVALGLVVRGRRGDAVLLASALALVAPLVAALKDVFERPRPALWESIAPAQGFSFPSAHAAGSLTLAVILVALAWRTRWRRVAVVACATFGFGVGLSRVYLGVHFPSDVVAGWCVAASWALALWLLRMLLLRYQALLARSSVRTG